MKWAYYASGFREKRGELSGTRETAMKVQRRFQSADCTVRYVEWDDNPKGYARDLATHWEEGDVLIVSGYSWGCGNWVKKFLTELFKLNPSIEVSYLVLADPVVRSCNPLFRWLAISPWGTIKLPGNINRKHSFFQRQNEPNASAITIGGKKVEHDTELKVKHTHMDNHPRVIGKLLGAAQVYLG